MAEYIEREKVIRILNDNIGNSAIKSAVNGYPEEYFDGWTDATSEAITEVEGIPTADVRPERHGSWKPEGDYGITKCSVCRWSIEECIDWNYCPYCGAKMDGKNSENND